METKLEEIYNNYVEDTKGNIENTIEIQRKLEKYIREKKEPINQQDLEKFKDQIYEIAAIGEKNGFINGFRYAAMLFAECFAGARNIIVEP